MAEITTNRIEEVLLEKKEKQYVDELMAACSNLVEKLNRYCCVQMSGSEEGRQVKQWIESFFKFGWEIKSEPCNIRHMPEFVRKKLLESAVEEFLESVESTKEIIDSLGGDPDS